MTSDFKPCRKCKSKGELPDGFILDSFGEVSKCSCRVTWEETELLKIKLEESSIPTSIISKNFNDYVGKDLTAVTKSKLFVERFREKGLNKSLFFYGKNGTQKTTTAYIVGKEVLNQGFSVFYIRTMDLIPKHFGTFSPTNEDLSFISKAENSDLVIIDECFARKRNDSVSDYQLINLRNFLKNRLEVLEKSTIFISNYQIDQIISQGFDKGIYDLVRRNTLGKVLTFNDVYFEETTDFQIDDLFI